MGTINDDYQLHNMLALFVSVVMFVSGVAGQNDSDQHEESTLSTLPTLSPILYYAQCAAYKETWPTRKVSDCPTPYANYTVLKPKGFIISCPACPGIVGVTLKWLPLIYRATFLIKETGGPLCNNGTHWTYEVLDYRVEGNYVQYYTLIFNCLYEDGTYEIVPRTFDQKIEEFEDTAIYRNPVSELESGTRPSWLAW